MNAPPDAEAELRPPRAFASSLRRLERSYARLLPNLRRQIRLAQIELQAAREARRKRLPISCTGSVMELHCLVGEARVDLSAARTAIASLKQWRAELTTPSAAAVLVLESRPGPSRPVHPTNPSTDMSDTTKPTGAPEGGGYIEPSVADRYASMSNTAPGAVPLSKNPDAMAIANKAGTAYGYRPSPATIEAATPRIVNGGGKQ